MPSTLCVILFSDTKTWMPLLPMQCCGSASHGTAAAPSQGMHSVENGKRTCLSLVMSQNLAAVLCVSTKLMRALYRLLLTNLPPQCQTESKRNLTDSQTRPVDGTVKASDAVLELSPMCQSEPANGCGIRDARRCQLFLSSLPFLALAKTHSSLRSKGLRGKNFQ